MVTGREVILVMADGRTVYGDIIDRAHHVSGKRPQMMWGKRAAQFSPFAALVGYDDLIAESGRLTEARRELAEDKIAELNAKMCVLKQHVDEHPRVTIRYFMEDIKKLGGSYVEIDGEINQINEYEKSILLMSGTEIFIEDVFDIACDIFLSL